MRIILKIVAAPFLAVFAVLWAFLAFLFSWGKLITGIASALVMLLAILLFLSGQTTGGIVFIIIAFLLSPVGLPIIAEWLIKRLGDLVARLAAFMKS